MKEHSQLKTQMFRFYIVWGHFETQTQQEEVNPWPIAWCRNCYPQKWTWPLFWQAWRVNSTPLNFSKKFKFLSQTLHLQGRTAPSKAPMIWHKKLTKLGTNKQLVQVVVGNGGKTSGRDRTESRWEGGEGRGGEESLNPVSSLTQSATSHTLLQTLGGVSVGYHQVHTSGLKYSDVLLSGEEKFEWHSKE